MLRSYFERYIEAALRNLKTGSALDYRFTVNEVLSIIAFLKQRGLVRSAIIRTACVSVLLPGQLQLQGLSRSEGSEDSSLFLDTLSANVSTSSCYRPKTSLTFLLTYMTNIHNFRIGRLNVRGLSTTFMVRNFNSTLTTTTSSVSPKTK